MYKQSSYYRLVVLFIFWIPTLAFAQKEGNIWYFGFDRGGLDFNKTPPTRLSDGQIRFGREAATMADECGNLLFYSEGDVVWDATHQIMPNGDTLTNTGSNFQKAVAIPYPAHDSLYVLFTSGRDNFSSNSVDKLSYSIVDMRLNNKEGAVSSRKNFLWRIGTNQMTAVRHANGRDFWLLAAEADPDALVQTDNRLLAFLINEQGVQPVPMVNALDNVDFDNTQFRVRASPNGRKVIVGAFLVQGNTSNVGTGILLDFDNATGKVTRTTLVPGGGFGLDYDFSPDSKKVYAGFSDGVYQYQIDRPNGAQIAQTRTLVTNSRQVWSMRLAPDGKLYIAAIPQGDVDVIPNPDAIGSSVQYQRRVYRFRDVGNLPNNVASFTVGKQKDFQAKALCEGQPVVFTPQVNYRVVQWQWNFGDPASGAANESTQQSPTHAFSAAGTYRVRMVTLNRCQEYDTVTRAITAYPDPVQDLPDSVEVCFSEAPVSFTAQEYPLTRYRWNTGDSTLSIKAAQTGWYRVTASNPCAVRSDSVFLRVIPKAKALIADDTVFCAGLHALIDAGFEGATYLWSTGETTRTVSIADSGSYWVRITNRCSAAVDSFRVVFVPQDISAIIPNVFTPNQDGVNDRFENYTLNRNYQLVVCNRWGRIVYQTRRPLAYWDGQVNGLPAETGIYFYAITATDCRGNPVTYKGHLSLLR